MYRTASPFCKQTFDIPLVHESTLISQLQIHELPKPSFTNKTLRELRIGTFENIETATEETSIILALKKFVERRVSALPIVDCEGKLVNIYSKFDVIVSHIVSISTFIRNCVYNK